MDIKDQLKSQEIVMYTLSANKFYSIFFEVNTTAGIMNVSHDTFSKIRHILSATNTAPIKQQPMMSRVCQWKRKEEEC